MPCLSQARFRHRAPAWCHHCASERARRRPRSETWATQQASPEHGSRLQEQAQRNGEEPGDAGERARVCRRQARTARIARTAQEPDSWDRRGQEQRGTHRSRTPTWDSWLTTTGGALLPDPVSVLCSAAAAYLNSPGCVPAQLPQFVPLLPTVACSFCAHTPTPGRVASDICSWTFALDYCDLRQNLHTHHANSTRRTHTAHRHRADTPSADQRFARLANNPSTPTSHSSIFLSPSSSFDWGPAVHPALSLVSDLASFCGPRQPQNARSRRFQTHPVARRAAAAATCPPTPAPRQRPVALYCCPAHTWWSLSTPRCMRPGSR